MSEVNRVAAPPINLMRDETGRLSEGDASAVPELKIVVLTPTFFPVVGGAEVGIHEIYRRIGRWHRVTVLTPDLGARSTEQRPRDEDAEPPYTVRHFRSRLIASRRPWLRPLSYLGLAEARALRAVVRNLGGIDVLNMHFLRPHGLVTLYCRVWLRVPVLVSLVGRTDVYRSMSRPRRWHAAASLLPANAVIQNSPFYLDGSPFADRASVVPFGSDLPAIAVQQPIADVRDRFGVGQDTTVLLAVQRLVPLKRVDLLIDVLARLPEDIDATLVVAGDGPERARLEAKARALRDVKVVFTGRVSREELAALYGTAQIFVTHTENETFGVMLAEAMSVGLPIVAARTTCIPMVVRDGEDGLLVDAYDLDAFLSAVVRLCRDEQLRLNISASGAARAKREFSWETIAASYELIMRQMSEASKRREVGSKTS